MTDNLNDGIKKGLEDEDIGDASNPIKLLGEFSPKDEEYLANTDAIQWELLKQTKRIADALWNMQETGLSLKR